MFLDDRIRDGQAESGSLANVLRREKRVEDFRLNLLRDPRPIVIDLEHDCIAVHVVPRAQDQGAAAVSPDHGLLGIHDQVEQHLLDLVRVGKYVRQPRGKRLEDCDVAETLIVGAQRQCFANDTIEIHHRPRRMTLARERQKVADDFRRTLGLAENGFQSAACPFVNVLLRETLGPRQNRRQWIVQFVGDARNRLAKRRQLLCLEQLVIQIPRLILESLAFADVAHQRVDP